MPYPQRNPGFLAAFINSQKPPPGSHLSAFLHGESVMDSGRNKKWPTILHHVPRRATDPVSRAPADSFDGYYGPDLRPRASTMSVIDPVHSPILGTQRSNESTAFYHQSRDLELGRHTDDAVAPAGKLQAASNIPGKHNKSKRKQYIEIRSKKWEKTRPKPMLFPKVKDQQVRRKSIGTLLSGTLLTLVLTTYLALATSNIVPTATFHAVFIFFILLLTIIFGHFLVRLCMLAFNPRHQSVSKQSYGKGQQLSTGPPVRSSVPHSRRPIRLLPPYSSPPRHYRGNTKNGQQNDSTADSTGERTSHSHSRHESSSETDIEKALPAIPPPAYGRWRGSVRIDNPERVDLQQLTRELVMAGAREESREERRRRRAAVGGWRRRGSPSSSSSSQSQQQEPPSYTSQACEDSNQVIGVHVDVNVVSEDNGGPYHGIRDDNNLAFSNGSTASLAAPAPLFAGRRNRRE